jgi:abortive infection bacteriophage resistance protein
MTLQNKPWFNYKNQIKRLKNRNLIISNKKKAQKKLSNIGYYRLSGYWYVFRKKEQGTITNNFIDGTSFQDVMKLYTFDKKLRLLVLDALERIEISLRVDLSYYLGKKDILAYKDNTFFTSDFITNKQRKFNQKHKDAISAAARKKEDFIMHYDNHYDLNNLPIWVASEVWDFGGIVTLFNGLDSPYIDRITKKYNVLPTFFQRWLFSFLSLRNISAHHSRLWNKKLQSPPLPKNPHKPNWMKQIDSNETTKIYFHLCLLKFILLKINPNSKWYDRVIEHLESFPIFTHTSLVSRKLLGIPFSLNLRDHWNSIK